MVIFVLIATLGCKKNQPAGTGSAGSGSAGSAAVVVEPAAGSAGSAAGSGADPWSAKAGSDDAGSAAPTVDAGADAPKLGKDVMKKETIGGIKIGDASRGVEQMYGEPESRSPEEEVPATGDTIETIKYPGATLVITKGADKSFTVSSIHITAPSGAGTSRGIKIGSPKADVERHYKKSSEGGDDPNTFLVGSPYGGELFTFKHGKVTEIFLGAMAE